MKYHSLRRFTTLCLGLTLLLLATISFAEPTGKITGRVMLEDTKESAIAASVLIVELKTGTKTDLDGYYTILNVPPGTYTLSFGYVGYTRVTVKGVIVMSGATFTQNVSMKPYSVGLGSPIEVMAEKPRVELDKSSSSSTIRTESLKQSTQDNLTGVLSKQSGVKIDREGSLHIRGGRSGEVAFLPDASAPGMPPPPPPPPPYNPPPSNYYGRSGETYAHVHENQFKSVREEKPLSTFSIDVDNASYSNVRRFLNEGRLPPPDAVRVEELINYFPYQYPNPGDEQPCSVTTNLTECPWESSHYLLRIGLKARPISVRHAPPNNLVFLLDVSGSMSAPNKLPLVKQAFRMLVDQMRPCDRIAIVTYASRTGIALESTTGAYRDDIIRLIESLQAGGSTAGGQGIQLAYRVAQENFLEEGNNRVILATDGDFNVGISNDEELVRMIEQKRKTGVFLTVLGFGEGNLQDAKMEKLADKGNGQYHYIDDALEARKVFVDELGSTLVTVAKDVKVQVEFNPGRVQAYRLVGYENRMLAAQDFNNDRKDAGEMGAGHTVTALYELVPVDAAYPTPEVDPLRYQPSDDPVPKPVNKGGEWLFVKVRYKEPAEETSKLMSKAVKGEPQSLSRSTDDMRFAVAVAEFGMLLRNSHHYGSASYDDVLHLARSGLGNDDKDYRREFVHLAEMAQSLSNGR